MSMSSEHCWIWRRHIFCLFALVFNEYVVGKFWLIAYCSGVSVKRSQYKEIHFIFMLSRSSILSNSNLLHCGDNIRQMKSKEIAICATSINCNENHFCNVQRRSLMAHSIDVCLVAFSLLSVFELYIFIGCGRLCRLCCLLMWPFITTISMVLELRFILSRLDQCEWIW